MPEVAHQVLGKHCCLNNLYTVSTVLNLTTDSTVPPSQAVPNLSHSHESKAICHKIKMNDLITCNVTCCRDTKTWGGQASLRVWALSCTLRRHGPARLTDPLPITRRRHISTVTIRDRVKLQTIKDPLTHCHLPRDVGIASDLLHQLQCRRHPYFRAMSRFVISLRARSAKIPWSMSLVSSSIVVLLFQPEALVSLPFIAISSHHTNTRSDWKCQLRIYDSSVEQDTESSICLNIFRPSSEMPKAGCGDVVLIRSAKVRATIYHGQHPH